jgi:hypothetical protein
VTVAIPAGYDHPSVDAAVERLRERLGAAVPVTVERAATP